MATGYHIVQHRERAFPSSQRVLLGNNALDRGLDEIGGQTSKQENKSKIWRKMRLRIERSVLRPRP
jgi:hypothetical protein